MKRDVVKYVKTCNRCQVNKPCRKPTSAPLQLMPIPETPWEVISLDFITNLPKSKGYDSILVVVCYLTKMTHLIPTHMTADAVKVAELFIEHIFRLHGLPKATVSDRDPKFTSEFWQALFKTLETQVRLSTAFHPERDGQTERLNQTIEIMLRHWTTDQPPGPSISQSSSLLTTRHLTYLQDTPLSLSSTVQIPKAPSA